MKVGYKWVNKTEESSRQVGGRDDEADAKLDHVKAGLTLCFFLKETSLAHEEGCPAPG